MKGDEDAGRGGCAGLLTERIRYFTGRYMTARDFHDADAYHRSFRYLHNRILHGWGVACGLEVNHHPRPECRPDRVIVRCGLAIDCCGREIVVGRDVVTDRMPWDEKPSDQAQDSKDADWVLLLCLMHRECCTDKVPVLYSPSGCCNPSTEFSRIRETYELRWKWVRFDDLGEYRWIAPETCAPPPELLRGHGRVEEQEEQRHEQGHEQGHERHDLPEQSLGEADRHCCLDPTCPPHHCVALALVRPPRQDDKDKRWSIDISGRRSVAHAREHLTHICWTSWTHGGAVKADDLDRLVVRFDRPLMRPEASEAPGPRGINERTFVVQYGEQLPDRQVEDLDFVEYARAPYMMADRRTAVYEIRRPFTYRNHIVHVTLKCDFIVDCRKQAVDGDHLLGQLPTGNGIPGGTFESWFRVVENGPHPRRRGRETASSQESRP